MLASAARLRSGREIQRVVRSGRRAAGGHQLSVHLLLPTDPDCGPTPVTSAGPAQVAFAVGRPVGSAVSRNRLRRRLRHIVADRLDQLAPGTRLVLRAGPAAAALSPSALRQGVDAALGRALGQAPTGPGPDRLNSAGRAR